MMNDEVEKSPSEAKSQDFITAGQKSTAVRSNTPENKEGHINPSAPEDSNVTPGTAGTK